MDVSPGTRQIVGFAGFAAAVESRSSELIRMLRTCYDGFLEGDPDFRVKTVVYGAPEEYPPNAARGSEVEILRSDERIMLRSRDFEALIDIGAREISTWQPCAVHPIDMCLRVAYGALHGQHGGFLLHAGGVVRGGLAYVFHGPPGAGKSTIVDVLGGTRLADEAVAIRRTESGFTASGTPYWMGADACAPIGGIFALRQSGDVRVVLQDRDQAAEEIFRSVEAPGADRETMDSVLRECVELAGGVPAGELHFNLDADAIWNGISRYIGYDRNP